MAIKLTDQDHQKMDAFLGFVLDAYASDEVTKSQAIATLAHVLTAAAIDNHGEVLAWFSPDQFERWKREARAAR